MNSEVMSQPGGIDIHAALAILSARTPHEHHEDDHHHQSSSDPPSLPSAVDNTRAQQSSTATNEENNDDDDTEGASAVAGEERQRQQERVNEMQTQLATMSIPQLIKMIFAAQEERVATYRAFEE